MRLTPVALALLAGFGLFAFSKSAKAGTVMTSTHYQDTGNVYLPMNVDISNFDPSMDTDVTAEILASFAVTPLMENVQDYPPPVFVPYQNGAPIEQPQRATESDPIYFVPIEPMIAVDSESAPPYVPFEEGFPVSTSGVVDSPTYSPPDVSMPTNDPSKNVAAFLYTIRACENSLASVKDQSCYGKFYSGNAKFNPRELLNQTFSSFADHPIVTGECKPVPLPSTICRNAGLKPGCVSTAAGAYQITYPTWQRAQAALNLPDMSPASQDRAAVWLLDDCGALSEIEAGNFDRAISLASKVWASLPKSSAGQNPKNMAYAIARFAEGQAIYA